MVAAVSDAAMPAWVDDEVEKQMEFLMGVMRAIRNLRTELNCPPGKEVKVDLLRRRTGSGFSARAGALSARAGAGRRGGVSCQRRRGPKARPPRWSVRWRSICRSTIWSISTRNGRGLTKEVGKVEDEIGAGAKKACQRRFSRQGQSRRSIQKERDKASQFEEKLRTLRSELGQASTEIQAGRN